MGGKGRAWRTSPGLAEGAGAQPEHRQKEKRKKKKKKKEKNLRKTGKDFPILSPPTLTFYDNSYFQMKGEKSQERNSQMSQKGKKNL